MIYKSCEPYFKGKYYKDSKSNVETEILLFFEKYLPILNLLPTTRSKKVGTGACLPLCFITSSFSITL